jgi:hypothetical protein
VHEVHTNSFRHDDCARCVIIDHQQLFNGSLSTLNHYQPSIVTATAVGRSGDAAGRGRLVAGQLPSGLGDDRQTGVVTILENGALFNVDIVQGQKTGFFLDQVSIADDMIDKAVCC